MIRPITATLLAVAISCSCFAAPSFAQSDSTSQKPAVPPVLQTFEPRLTPAPEVEKTSSTILSELEADVDDLQMRGSTNSGNKEKLPSLDTSQYEPPAQRSVSQKWVHWKSDDFSHRHLLFEQRDFERHGVPKCTETKQVFKSGARFFSRALFLPITAATKKPLKYQCAPGK